MQTSFVDLCCCALGGLILLMMLLFPVPGVGLPDEPAKASIDIEIRLPTVDSNSCDLACGPLCRDWEFYNTMPAFADGDTVDLQIGINHFDLVPSGPERYSAEHPTYLHPFHYQEHNRCDGVEQAVFRYQTAERDVAELLPLEGTIVASLSMPVGIGETQFEHWRALSRGTPGWSSRLTETAPSVAVGVRPGSGDARRAWYLPIFHVHEPDHCLVEPARWGPTDGEDDVEMQALSAACSQMAGCTQARNTIMGDFTAATFAFPTCPPSTRWVTRVRLTWRFKLTAREDEGGGQDVKIQLGDIEAVGFDTKP